MIAFWVASLVAAPAVQALDRKIGEYKGCKVRVDGVSRADSPDVIPNPKVLLRSKLLTTDPNEILRETQDTRPNTRPGDGFVLYCSSQLKSAPKFRIIAAIEFTADNATWKPTFAYAKVWISGGLNGVDRRTVASVDLTKERAAVTTNRSDQSLTKVVLEGRASVSHWQGREGEPSSPSVTSNNFFLFIFSLKGKEPDDSLTIPPGW